MIKNTLLFLLLAALPATIVIAADETKTYSPAVGETFPRKLLFGDTHAHSNNSPDSFSFGNLGQTPELTYRFARGEAMTAHNGMDVKIRVPMDFLVLSDHAEYLGVFSRLADDDADLISTELGGRWHEMMQAGKHGALMADFVQSLGADHPPRLPKQSRSTIWSDITRINDSFNEPGVFTTFNAYEWTSMPDSNNLHRVVIFKDGADKAGKVIPFSALDSADPEDLWSYLADYEKTHGGRAMAIAHNGNLSNGLMFADTTLSGEPLTADYAKRRMRWEPIYEVTQVKGDGEAHPRLSPGDPFADYESWDVSNLLPQNEKADWMLQYEYARSALKLGLGHEAKLGVNPFQFGLIGGTDIHTGLPDPDEANFFGKFPDSEPGPERTQNKMGGILWPNWRLAASGYAAVWARENTRDSIFAAMQRRETYATTGTRIAVRMFAGWDFEPGDEHQPDIAAAGYSRGVPMGGELNAEGKDASAAPRILVMAARDPDGANLERIQVVKGWRDGDGRLREKVYDVVLAPGVNADPDKSPSTVKGTGFNNSIGAPQLATVWRDPAFDPKARAFYYVRVLEIPTPRWTAYDAEYFDLELASEIPTVTRERAYTSPVWYSP